MAQISPIPPITEYYVIKRKNGESQTLGKYLGTLFFQEGDSLFWTKEPARAYKYRSESEALAAAQRMFAEITVADQQSLGTTEYTTAHIVYSEEVPSSDDNTTVELSDGTTYEGVPDKDRIIENCTQQLEALLEHLERVNETLTSEINELDEDREVLTEKMADIDCERGELEVYQERVGAALYHLLEGEECTIRC